MRPTIHRATMQLRARFAGWRARPRRMAGDPHLEARVERLEAGLEALQDATYRQDVMHDEKIAELRHNQGRL